MDQANAPMAVPPLSPAGSSSHSEPSLDELDFSVKPLPLPPSSKRSSKNGHEDKRLPALQIAQGQLDGLDPITEEDLDPGSFDLVLPVEQDDTSSLKHILERRSELLFSNRHMQSILDDSAQLHRFSGFLHRHRPASVPLLTYFLNALKALRAIEYSNAVLRQLGPLSDFNFTQDFYQAQRTANPELQDKANAAFDILAREDLPMYITHAWIQTVSMSIKHRIMGIPSNASEGLAEVFCLTDPSRHDNPIVFMSEEFNRTTQYGVDYVIGRNCRFLQGPYSNPFSISRIREKVEAGVEHYETFLNYRRDGSPFMNLVMVAPLYDSRGNIRYFIGAQVDVSGLAMSCYDLGSLERLVDQDSRADSGKPDPSPPKTEFAQLAEILEPHELDVIREHGGEMHRLPLQAESGLRLDEKITTRPRGSSVHEEARHTRTGSRNRVVLGQSGSEETAATRRERGLQDLPTTAATLAPSHNGRLTGVYENYLLVRPYPSLRILFTSPSMRVPGILQSPLLDRIGGSMQMREQLVDAFASGQSVTAKVKWLTVSHKAAASYQQRRRPNNTQRDHPLDAHLDSLDDMDSSPEAAESAGRSRWIHCTPLLGSNAKVGVWMIVIVDDEAEPDYLDTRRIPAPRGVSSRVEAVPSKLSAKNHHQTNGAHHSGEALNDSRPRMRPRKSSDTLGSSRPSSPGKPPEESMTQIIHKQTSSSSLRTPAPTSKVHAAPARFSNPETPSGAALPSRSAPAPDDQPRQNGIHGHPSENHFDPAMVRPPRPLRIGSPAHTQGKSHREAIVRVPSVIRETSSSPPQQYQDGETCSVGSHNSAFTVRIDEAI